MIKFGLDWFGLVWIGLDWIGSGSDGSGKSAGQIVIKVSTSTSISMTRFGLDW